MHYGGNPQGQTHFVYARCVNEQETGVRTRRASVAGAVLAGLVVISTITTKTQSQVGEWAPVMDWGYQAKHMAALPNGRVLVFRTGDTARVWDPLTGAFLMAPSLFGDLHCAIQLTLADGRVIVVGGQMNSTHIGTKVTSIFDPATNTWTQGALMNFARWYPSATPLGNGEILVTTGDDDHGTRVKIPEVYNPTTNTWRQLTTAEREQALYASMYQLPNGKVYEAAPSTTTAYLDVSGSGSWSAGPVSQWSTAAYSESGAMYAPGKILRVGGGDPAIARTAVIDTNLANPQWRETSPMSFPRRRMNLVILADGSLMAVGGTRSSDSESAAVLEGEIWDPGTEQWSTVAPMAEARMYHSTALLLEDGRVLSGGGEAAGRNHAQIYSPPYLFKGARPVISSAPPTAAYGTTFFVGTSTPSTITSVALLRSGAPTHAIDMNQRYVPLPFTSTGGGLNVVAPPDGNHTPPGYYMLLIKDSTGVPSAAKWIRVGSGVSSGPGTVTGRVTNASTGIGVAGATVQYLGGSMTTDPDGSYQFSTVAAGQHTFSVAAAGYASMSKSVSVSPGQTSTLAFALVEPGAITGRVTDSLGNPLSGATISFSGGSTTTSTSGSYTIPSIASGAQTITASATSYVTSSRTVTVPPNGSVTSNFMLAVTPSFIAGEVIDVSSNTSIVGATVSYYGGSVLTDSLGRYKLDNVTPGIVSVTVGLAGYVGETQEVIVPFGNYATSDFDLTPLIGPAPAPSPTGIKDITLEGGGLTAAPNGFDKTSAGVQLTLVNPLKGFRSATATTGEAEESFVATEDLYLSLYLRVNALTSGTPRIIVISNNGTNIGSLSLTSSGKLRLRNGSSTVGSDSTPLIAGQIYRVGLHQKRGTGKNAVLEAFLAQGDSPFTARFAGLTNGTWKTAADRVRLGATNDDVNVTVDDVRLDRAAMPAPSTLSSSPAPIVAGFVANVISGTAPLTVNFNSTGSSGSLLSFAWDFQNDGTTDSTLENPTVIYSAPGTYSVTLAVSDGAVTASTTRAAYITVTAPPPAVTGFAPLSGAVGTQVTITGAGLAGATSVTFNNVASTGVTVDSNTQVRATVPASATTGVIRVTTATGTATSPSAFAVTTVTPPPGNLLTTTLLADATVNSGNPTKVDGGSTTLRTRLGDVSNPITYNSYLKFDVTGLNGTVTAARLRIYATDANAAGVSVYASGSNWAENGISWSTAPPLGALLGTTGAITAGSWIEITLTPGYFTANQPYTVVLSGKSATSEYFGSRESTTMPQLTLTVSP